MESYRADVVVVGAGAAGLAAAAKLCAAGLEIVVVEARNRIGGRIFTIKDAPGLPLELGAEFIHGKPAEIFGLVDSEALLVCDVAESHWQLYKGRLVKNQKFWKEVDQIMSAMKQETQDCSFLDFINRRYTAAKWHEARAAALSYVQGFNAAEAGNISVHSLAQQSDAAEAIGGDSAFRFVQGYAGLVACLEQRLKSGRCTILCASPVAAIKWARQNVEAATQTHSISARYAIITVPLGVLQAPLAAPGSICFEPPIPQKQQAIDALAMGQVTRIVLRMHSRFWESIELEAEDASKQSLRNFGFIHARDEALPTWWTQLHLRAPVLVGWAAGPSSGQFENKSAEYVYAAALASLASILHLPTPAVEKQVMSWHLHDWQSDPFSRGAYSYVPPGSLPAQELLAQSVSDTLFFAGEATNFQGHCGTVHGALQTGLRAAEEVLQVIK